MSLLQQNPGALWPTKLTGTGNFDFGSADRSRTVYWWVADEIAGSTPTLTVALYDGTTTTYFQNAVAMTAKGRVEWLDKPLVLDAGTYLRFVASAGNQIDVVASVSP